MTLKLFTYQIIELVVEKITACERQKQTDHFSLDDSEFARLHICELHMLLLTPDNLINTDLGLINHQRKLVFFEHRIYIRASKAWTSLTKQLRLVFQMTSGGSLSNLHKNSAFYEIFFTS